MNLHQLIIIVLARRKAALWLLCLLVGGVFVYSELQPRQYLGTASVMIDAHSNDPVAAPGSTGSSTGNTAYMGTQIDLIQSERVAVRAIRLLKLEDDANWHAQWMKSTQGRGTYDAWMAEQLLKKLEVKPSRESNVVNIGYLSTNPAFAAASANAFVRAYIDTNLELKVEPAKQYNAFFDERAKQLRSSLEQAQNKLSAYQRAKGIIGTDDKIDVENARLTELSSQVVTLQGIAAESSGRGGQGSSNSQEVLNNLTIGNLTSELSRQNARLSELKQRLGERNPQVIELQANINQLRSQLNVETGRVTSSLGVNTSVDRSRLAAAQAALAAQRERVLQLRGQRDEASVLVRDVDNAQHAYDAALARVTQTSLESQNTFTNVSIIKTASPPPFATTPRPLLNTAVAFVVGLMLAVGFALILEFTDRRLRFDSDVTDALRQHLLVRIPNGEASQRRAATGLRGRVARMIGTTPRIAT
jgi:succinoglycan biosynthesis transport protein ExoP